MQDGKEGGDQDGGGQQQTTDTSTTRTSESTTQEQSPGHFGVAPSPDGIGTVLVPAGGAEVNRETVTETSHTESSDKE